MEKGKRIIKATKSGEKGKKIIMTQGKERGNENQDKKLRKNMKLRRKLLRKWGRG